MRQDTAIGIRVSKPFRELYESQEFSRQIDADWMPWLVDGIELGDDVLDLAAGPGLAVPALRAASRRVTVAQAAPAFTTRLADRYASDPAVTVTDADPARLPFPDGRFTAATAVLSLHHLPSAAQQDQALAELARVLQPGGVIAGLSVLDGPHFRRLDTDGTCEPIDPLTLTPRLERAGFASVTVNVWTFPRFTGRTPAPAPSRTRQAR